MKNRKIFIADDEFDILEVYETLLIEEEDPLKYCLETFPSGNLLLEYLVGFYEKGNKLPLCILDMRMPGLSGLETAEEVRKIDPDVVIIIVTAYDDRSGSDIRKSLNKDIYYIKKPINYEEFYCLVTSLIKSWNRNFELKETSRLLKAERDLSIKLGSISDLNEAIDAILLFSSFIKGVDCGGFYILNKKSDSLDLVAHRGLTQEFLLNASHFKLDSPQGIFVKAGKLSYNHYENFTLSLKEDSDLKALIIIPIQYKQEIVGVLNLGSFIYDELPRESHHAIETISSHLGAVLTRIKGEEFIHESEKNLSSLFNKLEDFLFIVDFTGGLLYFNSVVEQRLGYRKEELLNKTVIELHHPEMIEEAKIVFSQIQSGERSDCLIPLMSKDGTVIQVESRVTKGTWNNKEVLFCVSRDIEEMKKNESELRKYKDHLEILVENRTGQLNDSTKILQKEIYMRTKAEDNLRASENEFRRLSEEYYTLLEAIPDILLVLDPDLKILWANKPAMNRIGRNPEVSKRCCTLLRRDSDPCENCIVLKSFSSGKIETERFLTSDDRYIDMRVNPIKDENNVVNRIIVIASDITEKILFEREAIRMSHLTSLGELAAGVAHEINNPINGIINYARILLDNGNEEADGQEILNNIIKEGRRISVIVKSLLSFARSGGERKLSVSVITILNDTIALINNDMNKDNIKCLLNFPEDLPQILAHPYQIQQVFLNLLTNARYALNEKYREPDDHKVIEIRGIEKVISDTLNIQIIFTDYGCGIKADDLDKVILPFFSTRPPGKGTGLGLSISYGIISDHNGKLIIDSVEGEYTKIIINLPVERKLL